MRPAHTSKKDTLMLKKTQTLTLLIEILTFYSQNNLITVHIHGYVSNTYR